MEGQNLELSAALLNDKDFDTKEANFPDADELPHLRSSFPFRLSAKASFFHKSRFSLYSGLQLVFRSIAYTRYEQVMATSSLLSLEAPLGLSYSVPVKKVLIQIYSGVGINYIVNDVTKTKFSSKNNVREISLEIVKYPTPGKFIEVGITLLQPTNANRYLTIGVSYQYQFKPLFSYYSSITIVGPGALFEFSKNMYPSYFALNVGYCFGFRKKESVNE